MLTLRTLAEGTLDLLLPAVCVLCRQPHRPHARDGIVCGVCLSQLVPFTWPLCERCGHPRLSLAVPAAPLARDDMRDGSARHQHVSPPEPSIALPAPPLPDCRWCPRLDPAIRAVRSVARMDQGTGGELVHALKYQGWTRVATPMAHRMSRLDWPRDVLDERAALVPLPLGHRRRRERGYNQAEELARPLSRLWRVPLWTDALVRTRETQSQVRLTPSQRASNVSQAFAVPLHRRASVRGQHLVLVDDVITTAATVNAAVQALLAGGARIISVVTFGRAPDPGDRAAPDSDFTRN